MAAGKGDSVLVIKDENADWLKVRVEQSGEEGYVPRSFVDLGPVALGGNSQGDGGLSSGLI